MQRWTGRNQPPSDPIGDGAEPAKEREGKKKRRERERKNQTEAGKNNSDNIPTDAVATPDKILSGVGEGNPETWIVDPDQSDRFRILKKMRSMEVDDIKTGVVEGVSASDFSCIELALPNMFS
ncbi:hypothetical protein RHMOL_Rhmol07G0252700 [Rhododendron molle]|uniref:Uncharacterized protein n=1 Tax=Rhododendron molle TaxID=49168 RepID=A0ACC0N4J2_RHOML|nr:hypothetical protein RHMOL_Rhmol07G0252700 [Rhododendron molle]